MSFNDDSGKTMIYKMVCESGEDSKDVKAGTVIKGKNVKLLIDWEEYFKTLLNRHSAVEGIVVDEIEGARRRRMTGRQALMKCE